MLWCSERSSPMTQDGSPCRGGAGYRVDDGLGIAGRAPGVVQRTAPVSGKVAVDYGQELVDIERLAHRLSGPAGEQLIDDLG
jgi:hypothetical protein